MTCNQDHRQVRIGGGKADGGLAQSWALHTFRLELENINEALDTALRRDRVDWMLPIASHLGRFLDMTGGSGPPPGAFDQQQPPPPQQPRFTSAA